ncbi:hypothetical protein [Stygiolobus caldivivus]|uniref:Uncharacterized protein n=1 Tax=Stygiolobus caldivivus TaxID=2824673 RepID=A0A8D5U960_9CREN|nr:hypothetical protein [Stygiolobus caldivivus]BCU71031.1 hypothetical protein KN1_23280 [Stygiolobus caldivivus]
MSKNLGGINEKIVRIVTSTSALLWSLLHLIVGYGAAVLASEAVGHSSLVFAMYSEYFGFNSALYLFAFYEIITYTRKLLTPFFFLFSFNTFLIIYTHLEPAPLLGKPLPIIPEVYPAILLDIILVVGSAILVVKNYVG